MTDHVIMPAADYVAACDSIRSKTGSTDKIKSGEMASIIDSIAAETEEISVSLDMKNGNQVIEPTSDEKLMAKVTITKPATLVPSNIVSGVNIGGVVGTYAGGSSGEGGYTLSDIINRRISGVVSDATATVVGAGAFDSCVGITKASLPACSEIGAHAFSGCASMSSIYAPKCTKIGDEAFKGCASLTAINMPSAGTLGIGAFQDCSSLKTVDLSAAIASIPDDCFNGCLSLSSLGDTVLMKVGKRAFQDCALLSSITFSNTYHLIGEDAFLQCDRLTYIGGTISAMSPIGSSAFCNCRNLSSVTLRLDSNAQNNSVFAWCDSLRRVTLASATNVPPIPVDWFEQTPISTGTGGYGSIYVPASLIASFRATSGWSVYSARMVAY